MHRVAVVFGRGHRNGEVLLLGRHVKRGSALGSLQVVLNDSRIIMTHYIGIISENARRVLDGSSINGVA